MVPTSVWLALLLDLSGALAQDVAPLTNVSAIDFGAVPDGKTLNTTAIQKAIDTCSEKGGGTVTFPAGRFVTGTVQIKDGVTLLFTDQAFLLGSTNIEDYQNLDPFKTGSDGNEQLGYALIIGKDAKNIGLAGHGVIDGRGADLRKSEGNYIRRPLLVRWVRCTGISVCDVTLKNSGAWTMNFFQSQNILVRHVTIHSRGLGNNDGIDVDSSHTGQITDCDIDSGDDSICFKATSPAPCGDIQVDKCTIHSGEGAFKFGTESMGDFENITISDCHVLEAQGGIKMFSVDGSHLHDILVSGITMENTNLPIMIRLGARLKVFRPGGTPLPMGQMDGIKIKDIVAKNCSNIGILVSGIPNHPVKKLVLENIDLQLNGNEKNGYANMVLPEKETDYPEIGMFGRIPASGAFLRHVEGIKIDKFTVSLKQPDMRSSLICQDGENIEFSNLEIPFDPAGEPSIRLDSCRHVSIVNLNLPGDVDSAHQLSQNGCSDITFQGK